MPRPIFDIVPNNGDDVIMFIGFDYKAPHALRPTPSRLRYKITRRRLFKGHRC